MTQGLTDYASIYRKNTGQEPSPELLAFYDRITQYDNLREQLNGIDAEISKRQERAAIQQGEREQQRGIRIFRRGAQ